MTKISKQDKLKIKEIYSNDAQMLAKVRGYLIEGYTLKQATYKAKNEKDGRNSDKRV